MQTLVTNYRISNAYRVYTYFYILYIFFILILYLNEPHFIRISMLSQLVVLSSQGVSR